MHKLLVRLRVPLLAVVLGVAGAAPNGSVYAQVVLASCATDNEITADKRAAIETTALGFVNNMVGSKATAAYEALTADAKQAVPFDQFAGFVRQAIAPMSPFTDVHVSHTYVIKAASGGANTRIICGNLGRPEDWVAVSAKPGAETAYAVVDAQTKNNGFTFTLWLVADQNWRVEYFNMTVSSIAGKTAQDIWQLARAEQNSRHLFNAAALYATANRLASRGPNFQLGIDPEIKKEMARLQVPRELQGNPPVAWKLGDDSFKILYVGPIGVGGKIYLSITQEIAPWSADQDADQQNSVLITEFIRSFPEYSNVFAGLVVGASEAGGHRLFTTVYESKSSSH